MPAAVRPPITPTVIRGRRVRPGGRTAAGNRQARNQRRMNCRHMNWRHMNWRHMNCRHMDRRRRGCGCAAVISCPMRCLRRCPGRRRGLIRAAWARTRRHSGVLMTAMR